MYTLYFENDLKYVKERTDEQVQSYRIRNEQHFEGIDAIQKENEILKRNIKAVKSKIENDLNQLKNGVDPI